MSQPRQPTDWAYQDPFETWNQKFMRKFKENPWVPLGCAATCGALVMSAIKMRKGKSTEMNHWLRARVALQGLTLGALVIGSVAIRNARQEKIEASEAAAAAEKGLSGMDTELLKSRQQEKEKEEFEHRLKEAQLTTELEENAGFGSMKTVKGPAVNTQRREEERRKQQERAEVMGKPDVGPTTEAVRKSASWFWWSSSKSSDSSTSDKDAFKS